MNAPSSGKKVLTGFISTMAWLVLVLCILATTTNFVLGGLSKIGNSASSLVETISSNPAAINSLIDEFEKNAEPKAAALIEKNRAQIEETLSALGKSDNFRTSLEKTLNQISDAVLNGSTSVTVDFSDLAHQVADEINTAAKAKVITNSNLDEVVPATLDLSKQSETITNVKKAVHLSLLLWIVWLALIGLLVWLKGKQVLRTSGIQLISVGILATVVHFLLPMALTHATENTDMAVFQRDAIAEGAKIIASPSLILGVVATLVGLVLVFLARGQKLEDGATSNQ